MGGGGDPHKCHGGGDPHKYHWGGDPHKCDLIKHLHTLVHIEVNLINDSGFF